MTAGRGQASRKVLEITSYPPPRAGWGVRVEFLKRHLEAAGHTCVVLNLGEARTIPSPEYETVLGGVDFVRKVWRFARQGFIVHMHGNGESPKGFVLMLLAELIGRAWRRPCYLTFHAGVEQVYFPRPKSPALLPVYKAIFALPRAIICNSQAVKDKIVEYGVDPNKIFPIPAFSRQYVEFRRVQLPEHVEHFLKHVTEPVFTYVRIREGFYLETLLDGFALLASQRAGVGLLLSGAMGDVEPPVMAMVQERIQCADLAGHVCVIDDLDHDQFLTALTRSRLYLRTPTTDGVASSVLESLALRVPVVASENGSRPPGVVTYQASDPDDLAAKVAGVLADHQAISAAIPVPDIRDTVAIEVDLLTR